MISRIFRPMVIVLFLLAIAPSTFAKTKKEPAATGKDKVCRQVVQNLTDGKVTDPKRQALRDRDVTSAHAPGMRIAAQELLKKQENYNRTRPQKNRVKWIVTDAKKGYRIAPDGLRELCTLYAAAIMRNPQRWCGGKKCSNQKKSGQGQGSGQGNPPPPGGQQNPPSPTPGADPNADTAPLSKADAEVIAESLSTLSPTLKAGPLLNDGRADDKRVHVFQPAFDMSTQEIKNFFNLVGSRLIIKTNCKYGWFSRFSVEPSIYHDEKVKEAMADKQGKLRDRLGNLVYWAYRVSEQDQSVYCADPERGDEYFTLTLASVGGDVPLLSVKIQW